VGDLADHSHEPERDAMLRLLLCALLTVPVTFASAPARADEKEKPGAPSDRDFDRLLTVFLDDPLHEKAKDMARAVVLFTLETPKAAVVLGEPELKWIGKRDDDRSLLLFAAYTGGNTRSQLLSGVKQNDRFSGLVALFAVYRKLQEKDKDFKIDEVEALRKLHRDGKLLEHLVELEKKAPTKLGPEAEKALKELLDKKK
jgi:hypothetical protein